MKHPGCLASIAVVVLLLLAFIGLQAPIEALFFMVTGWAFFLGRVAPDLSVSWPGVATAIAALAVFVVGLHLFAKWWVAAVRGSAEEHRSEWQWRWTVMATAAVVLSFVAGISVVGATHQLVWMATSEQPLAENSWKHLYWRIQSKENLKTIGLALHSYHDEHQRFPAGGTFDRLGRPLFGWQTALLPYVDQAELYERINLEVPWDAPENAEALATIVPAYTDSRMKPEQQLDSSGMALSRYAGNGLVLNAGPGLRLTSIKDGTSNTFLAGDVNAHFKPWGHPVNWRDPALGINHSPDGFGGPWEGGAHLLFADGAVRFVSENIDQQTLNALATPDGGEPVGDF